MARISREYKIHSSTLCVCFGDITTSSSEVIVSSDDTLCTMGGGVSRAIKRAGGEQIYHDVQKCVPAALGDVVVTSAGVLPQKYVFHCVTLDFYAAAPKEDLRDYIICSAMEKCMKMLAPLNVSSIAFPVIGTGLASFSVERVCVTMAEVITEFLFNTNKSYRIEIFLFKQPTEQNIMESMSLFEAVAKAIDRYQYKAEHHLPTAPKPSVPMPINHLKMAVQSPLEAHDVFVSYSRKNMDLAMLFCQQLDEMGIRYWFDLDGSYSGENFKDVLVDAIDNTQIMVFLSSKDSNESLNVRKEISLAVSEGKRILPVRLDDTPYAKCIRYDLSDIDWLDYTPENHDSVMQKFRLCIQMYLQGSQA